jgi:ankyrin repeat protein
VSGYRLALLSSLAAATLVAAGAGAQARDDDAVVQAVLDGRHAELSALIARKANVDAVDDGGVTALELAVSALDTGTVELLLRAGADPDRANALGVTPLFVAIENGSGALAKLLLDSGASPNAVRANGETPLMLAVRNGSPEIVGLLLARKAKVDRAETEFGQTALMMSVGQPEIMRLLLASGADVKAKTRSWDVRNVIYTPATGTLGLTGIPWNNDGSFSGKMGGTTALLFAAQRGDPEGAKLLVDAGADVNEPAADGTTPLLASLYRWQVPADRPVDVQGVLVARPLGGLSFASHYALANYLLDKGAKVNVADRAGYTPLHGALVNLVDPAVIALQSNENGARRRSEYVPPADVLAAGVATIKRLLAAGADTNKPTLYPTPGPVGNVRVNPAPPGSTPLHIAAQVNSPEILRLLIAHRGNPNLVRKDGQTPFSVAAQVSNLDALKAMVAGGADLKMIYNPTEKVADPVLSKAEARRNVTVLHIAAVAGADTVIEYLVSAGAPLDVVNDHGELAVQLADNQERFRYAKSLEGFLNNGAPAERPKPVRATKLTDAFRRAGVGSPQTVTSGGR